MVIGEIRMDLDGARRARHSRILAYCDFTVLGCVRIRNARLYLDGKGGVDVLFPQAERKKACPKCGRSIGCESEWCSSCGEPLRRHGWPCGPHQGSRRDVVFPVSVEARERIRVQLIGAYEAARAGSRPRGATRDGDGNGVRRGRAGGDGAHGPARGTRTR